MNSYTRAHSYPGIGGQKDAELKGYLDEFYIFNRTLDESEIKQLYDKCKGPLAANVLHLDFKTVSGNFTKDTSFQGNNGYFMGKVVSGLYNFIVDIIDSYLCYVFDQFFNSITTLFFTIPNH